MYRKLPPLNALKAFEAAGRHQHFSKAGEELCVSHVAISKQVKELENWLGTRLFERTGRGVVLTEQGALYLKNLSPVFDELTRITRDVVDYRRDDKLRVTADPALAFRWLIQKLKGFSELHPELRVSVDPNEEVVNLVNSDFDLGIRFGSGNWTGVDALEIFRPNLFPVCSPDYLSKCDFRDLSDMKTVELLHDDSATSWEEWLRAAKVRRTKKANESTFEKFLALSAAESGLGFALGDELLCVEALKKNTLVRPLARTISSNKSYYLVYPAGLGDCDAVRRFSQWLCAEVKKSLEEFHILPDQ